MVAFRLYAIDLSDVLNSSYDSIEAYDPTR